MKHTTLNNTVAKSPCAYCKKKGCSLTYRQVKNKQCISKNCWHLVKYNHEVWRQRELKKQRKKMHRQERNRLYEEFIHAYRVPSPEATIISEASVISA